MNHTSDLQACKNYCTEKVVDRTYEIVADGFLLEGRPEGTVILPMDFSSRQDHDMLDIRSSEIEQWPLYLRGSKKGSFVIVTGSVDLSLVMERAFRWTLRVANAGTPLIQQIMIAETMEQAMAVKDNREWSDFPPGS